jgi:N-carbamoylputrescine amidase
MSILGVALLQIEAAAYDQAENLMRGERACRRAAALGADIALFPEMWNVGYEFQPGPRPLEPATTLPSAGLYRSPEAWAAHRDRVEGAVPAADLERWRAQAVPRDGAFVGRFGALAAELEMAIAISYLEEWPGAPRDTVTLFDRSGREVLTYAKVHTCDFDWPEAALTPGDGFLVAALATASGPVEVGAMICFDREFPETARILALAGAELVLVPNACPMEDNRTGQLRARAFENMVAVALANYPATHDDCDGHSVAFHPCAFDREGGSRDTLVARAGAGEEIVLARFDLAELRDWRRAEVFGGAFRRPHRYGRLVDDAVAEVFVRVDRGGRPYDPRRR